ncbi:MAG: RIP metalloprotease RseP [Niastella sp. SCN 39-18]|nr:RIP metalloprotease RseP [Sphingobacteriales bacterium]ODT51603.1 MAG: RIP metalloprotease RseP [Niastella sp. SCN 39-18]OJW08273.1 MAG: RIP metalloprotease RseP [Sphingobacteriales bacterium 39-19]
MFLSDTLLAINWSSVGLKVAQLLLSLSILVVLHEFGHFITAKWFKCRVEKFYLFFDPWFSIFKKKIGDTVYGIGWLPLGGYVKIAGMIDESMDKDQMKLPPQPFEFRSKPAWQRLIIMLGGVTVNVILAFFIYAMILWVWGQDRIINSSIKNGIWITDSVMYDIGLRNGDKLLAVNGDSIHYFEDAGKKILLSGGGYVAIVRNGKDTSLEIPRRLIGALVEKKRAKGSMFLPRIPAIMGAFDAKDTTPAARAHLQYWDKIVKVDSVPVAFLDEAATYFDSHKNETVNLTVDRKGSLLHLPVHLDENGKMGPALLSFPQYDSLNLFKYEHTSYNFFSSFPAGFKLAITSLKDYIDQFILILSPSTESYKAVGGFKAMGSVFSGDEWNWHQFWSITAFFSIVLAFMNLLPIPALDGGHVLFTLVEMITGRKPSDKFLEYAQVVGMVILLALMLYANGNDWFGWGKGK